MANRLFIDNLPLSVTLESLTTFFAASGTVTKIDIVLNQRTGRMEGHAFVEMSTDVEAKNAVRQLNGTTLAGNRLNVTHADPSPRQHIGFSGNANPGELKNR